MLPAWHWLSPAPQQPLQLLPEQADGVVHCPEFASQLWPHERQANPEEPQALAVSPERHTPPLSQQPFVQLEMLQPCA